jgi:hypothetical protein
MQQFGIIEPSGNDGFGGKRTGGFRNLSSIAGIGVRLHR